MLKLYQEGQLGFVLLRKCDHFLKKVSWEPCCSRNVSANQPKTITTTCVCLSVTWEPPVSDKKVSVTFLFISLYSSKHPKDQLEHGRVGDIYLHREIEPYRQEETNTQIQLQPPSM